jgi:hypothetical protein
MKKLLLLSAAASAVLMAGGDIAPVEPAVATPVVEASGWDFSGQAVVYYQTTNKGANDFFDQAASAADFGLQLRAVNKDVFAGIGAGVEVSGLSTLNLENWMVSNTMQGTGYGPGVDDITDGGWISQMYLTYGVANTTFKLGRQELPKSLSPFAFSESWNVFKNTFDAALVVNTDFANTTIVGAWVGGANFNSAPAVKVDRNGNPFVNNNMTDFDSVNGDDGVYMLTVQNKSIEGLTLTGTYYYAADLADNTLGANTGNDAHILWGDAHYKFGDYCVAGQVGTVMDDDFNDDTVAYGLKAGGNFGMFDASIAYSGVNDGGFGVFNVGGVKTPLYTQMILNQNYIRFDNDTFVVRAGVKALGGKFGFAYDYTSDNATNGDDYQEIDLTYKTTTLIENTTLFAGYIYSKLDSHDDGSSIFRVWGRYNF